ncbi:acyl-CoA-binding domain-containing protein 6 [Aplysia californica]|uniref:Acyl-CoA-binding domain-containing protein 6 n=1 Tax=Aplysia californica TaxID=6500 RepID=A0ABM0JQE0_APLCA|nr:acyl-CoA-binding domain-containing protein 6 [Aplysia californica]
MEEESGLEFDDLEEVFGSATEYVRRVSGKLESDKLLYFYARFKQAKEGKCNTAKPSFFDFQGKAKWDAWHKLGDMDKNQAMMEYISLLTNIDQEWRSKLSSQLNEQGDTDGGQTRGQTLGVSVSVMANTDSELSPDEKDIFDWCKEGNVEKVRELLTFGAEAVNGLDEEGLCLLHWASDRGFTNMVELLLSLDADINRQDMDQQTALHYAVSCDHADVAQLLMNHGINESLQDVEGNTAMDVASDDMKLLLRSLIEARSS